VLVNTARTTWTVPPCNRMTLFVPKTNAGPGRETAALKTTVPEKPPILVRLRKILCEDPWGILRLEGLADNVKSAETADVTEKDP
jgi:hypothetical protein